MKGGENCQAVDRRTLGKSRQRDIWFTERLWESARELPENDIEPEPFQELDEDCCFGTRPTSTIREIAAHCQPISQADTRSPVVINTNGCLMDGGHRLARALLEGTKTIKAVQFTQMPEPDASEDL